jgi:hypothetical protein
MEEQWAVGSDQWAVRNLGSGAVFDCPPLFSAALRSKALNRKACEGVAKGAKKAKLHDCQNLIDWTLVPWTLITGH